MSDFERSREFWKKVIGIIDLMVILGMLVLLWFVLGVLNRSGIDLGLLEDLLIVLGPTLPVALVHTALNEELNRRFPLN